MNLDIPDDWFDTTEDSAPFTLTKPDGVGALQFSVGLYESGEAPEFNCTKLSSLLLDFADTHSLSNISGAVQEQDALSLVAASFSSDTTTFCRVWYVSDGWSVAKVTYVCDLALLGAELGEAEQIVRSVRFATAGA